MAAFLAATRCTLRSRALPACYRSRRQLCVTGSEVSKGGASKEEAWESKGGASKEETWDIYRTDTTSGIAPSSMWKVRIDHKFSQEDIARFSQERAAFRADPRLSPEALERERHAGALEMDWQSTLIATTSLLRLGDYFAEPFRDRVVERLTDQGELMEHFHIPALADKDSTKPLHNHAVPNDGAYGILRKQCYWHTLHIWLLHSKQYLLQENEGLFGSALCALITRRLFEWTWNQFRGWMHDVDVPVMSLTDEVQDMQEYVFGFCVAMDQAFKDEAPDGTMAALALDDSDLAEGLYGLAPQVKHVLWSNVYSGLCPHDAPYLHELTVYILRQRAYMEGLERGEFYMCRWNWPDFRHSIADGHL